VKFTERGQVEVVARTVSLDERRARLRFEVRDTGIGISAETLETLFQPFTQADESITRRFGGTGLGLTISKRLVELMDGAIGAESTPGAGSVFWIELPLPIVDLASVVEDRAMAADAGPRGPRLNDLRVLVVDDNAMNRLLIERALQSEGARIAMAGDGQAALDRLQAEPGAFDVVLMDVQMPVMDGLTATRAIRDNPALRHLPVIAFTAGVLPEEREEALAAGVNGFLAKPVNLDTMASLLAPFRNPAGDQDSFIEKSQPTQPTDTLDLMNMLDPDTTTAGADALATLESLPGINFGPVLELVGGDREMLGQLLEGFLEEFAGLMDEADAALAAGERESLTKRMHTLKGTAANLGMQELSTQAAAVEMALKQQQPTAAPLATLRQSFAALLPLLRAACQPG
jgi:CheY-like chemotaxis protein